MLSFISIMEKLNNLVLKLIQFLHKTKHHCVISAYCEIDITKSTVMLF